MSDINETLKRKIDELDLDRRLNDVVDQAESRFRGAIELAADYATEHREEIDGVLDRLSTQIEQRTEGKYADKVDRVRGQFDLGLAKLTDRRTDRDPEPDPDL